MHLMIIRDCFILTAVQVLTWLVQENKGEGLPVNIQCIKASDNCYFHDIQKY